MPFELQPVLTGDLLELRPLRKDDFPALYVVASDPLIWEQHPEPDRHLSFQQEISRFNVAVVVLVAKGNRYSDLRPLVPDLLAVLIGVAPGQLVSLGACPRAATKARALQASTCMGASSAAGSRPAMGILAAGRGQ